ncbi:hypothetical protein GCM10027275_01990 [Rhabdobacter roseus]
MQMKAQADMQQRLDTHTFGEEELFTIKIPLNLPYWTETRHAPERIDGQIRYNNEFYKLYKQQVVGDTLEVLCVKDHTEKALLDSLTEWVKITVTGLPGTSEKASTLVSYLIKEYFSSSRQVLFFFYEWVVQSPLSTSPTLSWSAPWLSLTSPPPQLLG